jgi:hypothetical protein
MCRPGQSPLPRVYLRQMARLMQVHKDTHPERIARRFGVTEEVVRQLSEKYQPQELAPLPEALEVLYGRLEKDSMVSTERIKVGSTRYSSSPMSSECALGAQKIISVDAASLSRTPPGGSLTRR